METIKVKYTETLEAKPGWLKVDVVYQLKSSFLVIYEVLGATNGVPDEVNMRIRFEFPKSCWRRFKKLNGL